MNDIAAYILAGGRSSRFGSNKATTRIDGELQLDRVALMLRAHVDLITVVAAAEGDYAALGHRTIVDQIGGIGPMSGLHAALKDPVQASWRLVVSCDLLHVPEPVLGAVLDSRSDDCDAVAPRHCVWEPFLAAYHRRTLAEVERAIRDGRHGLQRLLSRIRTTPVPIDEQAAARMQFNTPQELERHYATRPTSPAV